MSSMPQKLFEVQCNTLHFYRGLAKRVNDYCMLGIRISKFVLNNMYEINPYFNCKLLKVKRQKAQTTRAQLHGLVRPYTHAHNRLHPSNYNVSNWNNHGQLFFPYQDSSAWYSLTATSKELQGRVVRIRLGSGQTVELSLGGLCVLPFYTY